MIDETRKHNLEDHFNDLQNLTIDSISDKLANKSIDIHASFEKYVNFEKSFEASTKQFEDKIEIKNLQALLQFEKNKTDQLEWTLKSKNKDLN